MQCKAYPVRCSGTAEGGSVYPVLCKVYGVRIGARCTPYGVPGVRCNVYPVRCEVYPMRCKVYPVRCTPHGGRWFGVPLTVYPVRCNVYGVRIIPYGVRCIPYCVPRTVCGVPRTV